MIFEKRNVKKILFLFFLIASLFVLFSCKKNQYVLISQDGSFNIFESESKPIHNSKKVKKGSKIIFKIKPEIKENAKKDGNILLYIKKNNDFLNPDLFQHEFIATEDTNLSLHKGELKDYKKLTISDYLKNFKNVALYEILKDGKLKECPTFFTDDEKNKYFANLKVGTKIRVKSVNESIIRNYYINDTLMHTNLDYFDFQIDENTTIKFDNNSFEKTKFRLNLEYPKNLVSVSGLKEEYKKGDKIVFKANGDFSVIKSFLKNNEKIQNHKKEVEITISDDLDIKIAESDIDLYDINHLKKEFTIIEHDEENKKIKFVYKDFYKKLEKLNIQKSTIIPNSNNLFEYEYENYPFVYDIKQEDIKKRDINFIKKEVKTSDVINFITYKLIPYSDNLANYELTENALTFLNAGNVKFLKYSKDTNTITDLEYYVKYDIKKYNYQSDKFLLKDNPIKYFLNSDLPLPSFKFIANNFNDEKSLTVLTSSNKLKDGFSLDIVNKEKNIALEYEKDYLFNYKENKIDLIKKDITDKEYNLIIKYNDIEVYKESIIFRKDGINIKNLDDLNKFLNDSQISNGFLFSNLLVDKIIDEEIKSNKILLGNFYKLEFKKNYSLFIKSKTYNYFDLLNLNILNNEKSISTIKFEKVNARIENNIYNGLSQFLHFAGGKINLDMIKFSSEQINSFNPIKIDFKNNNDSFLAENLDFSNFKSSISYIGLNVENNKDNKYNFNIISLKKSNPFLNKELSENITKNLMPDFLNKFVKDGKMISILTISGKIVKDNFKFKLFENEVSKNEVEKDEYILDEYLKYFKNDIIINAYLQFEYKEKIKNSEFENFKEFYINYLNNLAFSNELVLENYDFLSNNRQYFINIV